MTHTERRSPPRGALVFLAAALLAISEGAFTDRAQGQSTEKVRRVGVLTSNEPPGAFEHFSRRLRELGWVEGRNVVFEHRSAGGDLQRLPALATELVAAKVEVIFVRGPAVLRAARDATKTIPIVMMASSTNPVGQGFITSYARPGGNITGTAFTPEEVTVKRAQLLKELVPGAVRLGVFSESTSVGVASEIETGGRAFGIKAVIPFAVVEPETAVALAAKARVDGVIVVGTPYLIGHQQRIAAALLKHRLPAIAYWSSFVEAGVLMGYGPSLPEHLRAAAGYVDKILRGAKPGELPVERPTKFDLAINLKTAKALGITVPRALALRADQIIE